MVVFNNRKTMKAPSPSQTGVAGGTLDADTYEEARKRAPGWDVHHLEEQWQEWMAQGGQEPPRNPDKAFLGFCAAWFARRGWPG